MTGKRKSDDLRDDPLTPADETVMEIYRRTQKSIPWDASDDAILAMSRRNETTNFSPNLLDNAEPVQPTETAEQDDNVVSFAAAKQKRSILRSPAAGFAMAACLMVGLFGGQGLLPYVNLGTGPDYDKVVTDNDRLAKELADAQAEARRTRSINLRAPSTDEAAMPALATLSSLVGEFDCAGLSFAMAPERGVRVAGYVSNVNDVRRLRDALSSLGGEVRIKNDVVIRQKPFCTALDLVGVAYRGGATAPTIRPFRHGFEYKIGEHFIIEATASPGFDGYIYADLLQQNGDVIHLLPTPELADNAVIAGQRVVLGDTTSSYQVGGPTGEDMLMVFHSPVPLFADQRPEVEGGTTYLNDLRAALESRLSPGERDQVVANYSFISTVE